MQDRKKAALDRAISNPLALTIVHPSKFLDKADATHQQNTADNAAGVQRVRLHSEPAKMVDQQRGNQRSGHSKPNERPSAHFVDQRKAGIDLHCSHRPPTTAPQGNSAKSF